MSLFIDISGYTVYNNKHNDNVEVVYRMGRKSVAVLPQTQAILEQLGEQIKLARLRRHLSAELVAERAGVSRATVWNVEKGNPSVAIGIYAAVLHALNNCKKILRQENVDMQRSEVRHRVRECSFSELPSELLAKLCC